MAGDHGLFAIKEKKVDSKSKAVIDRVLIPYPIMSASYAFIKAMTIQQVSTVASFIGLSAGAKSINTSNPEPEIEKTVKRLAARQTAGNSPPPSTTSDSTAGKPPETPPAKTAAGLNMHGVGAHPNAEDRPMAKHVPELLTMAGPGPWDEFKNTYKRKWRPVKCQPPRGSLAVHGIVSLDSPKGRVFIDVFAWYHPKLDTFHSESMTINLRSITPYNQKPLRR